MRTWQPTTAGILTIISSCYGTGFGVALTKGVSLLHQLLGDGGKQVPLDMGGTPSEITAYGILYIVFGVVSLIGGISALRRKVWGLALAGAILSLWMIPVGTVLGILSIVFLAKSKGEFA